MRRRPRAIGAVASLGLIGAMTTALIATPPSSPDAHAADPVIAAAGDIACDPTDPNYNGGAGTASFCRQQDTAALLDAGYSAVLPLGDEQYTDGTLAKFQQVYDPSWGRTKSLHRPVPGNHEYLDTGAAGYYSYYGAAAGDPAKGWYSYDLGSWHLIALNGECGDVGGCGVGSAQETWLRADLAAHPATCTLAYWHEPRFTSSDASAVSSYQAFWNDLYAAGADVVLNGHQHNYERFAVQDPSGAVDSDGIREFVVGTGGKGLVSFGSPLTNSVARNSSTYGVLELTLHSASYTWRFVPVAGSSYTDTGSTSCSPASPAPSPSASVSPSAPPSTSPSTSPSAAPSPSPSPSPSTSLSPSPEPSGSAEPEPGCDPTVLASRRELTVGQPVDLDISGLRPERSVSLEGYARPSSAYTTFRTPTQPAADGTLRFTVQPTTGTRLRVRVEHCPEPGTSQVLIVHARLSLQVARVGPRHYVFSGSIAPGRVNAGRSVSLFYRTASGATLRRGYTTVSADGTYRLDIRFSGVGRLAFFTQTGSNTINAAATSPARSVLVS